MPIYVYRCERCGREVEEIQKYNDPPPVLVEDCVMGAEIDGNGLQPCELRRVPTTFEQRWLGDYSSEGRAGWQRQGKFMVKRTEGK